MPFGLLKTIGIEDCDGAAAECECCGAHCPKRRVVLADDNGTLHRYGVVCADLAVRGSRRSHGTALAAFERELAERAAAARAAAAREESARWNEAVRVLREDHPEVRPNLLGLRRARRAGVELSARVVEAFSAAGLRV